jgi:hypothetical protein
MSRAEREGSERHRGIDRYLAEDDPYDEGAAARMAYYERCADEQIGVMTDLHNDTQQRGWAEDVASEAMYRAMRLRHHGRLKDEPTRRRAKG